MGVINQETPLSEVIDTGSSASSSWRLSMKLDTLNFVLLMREWGGVELEPRHGSPGFEACVTLPALSIPLPCVW